MADAPMYFDRPSMVRIGNVVRDAEGRSSGTPLRGGPDTGGSLVILENTSGGRIPACSFVYQSAASFFEAGRLIIPVAQVTTTYPTEFFLTWDRELEDGNRCPPQAGEYVKFSYSTGSPAKWEAFGPKNGQWEGYRGYPATVICEGIYDSTAKIAVGRRVLPHTLIGKTTGIAKGSSGTFTVWYDNAGTLAVTSPAMTLSGYAIGRATASGKFVIATWINGKWILGCYEG